MSDTMILLNLLITIVIVVFLILKFRLNPVISMVLGSLYMGIACGVGLVETVGAITKGFGNLMAGIGLSVGFGVMLGQLVADSGAVQSIANTVLRVFGKERAHYALGSTGFIVSIPVFYDVAYVIMVPIARALSKQSKAIPYFVGALVAGAGFAHTFIPPTPGPLSGAQLLGLDIGLTILWGVILGLPTFLLSLWIYGRFILGSGKFWNPAADEDPQFSEAQAQKSAQEASAYASRKLPSFGAALFPILLPIVLILFGTVYGLVTPEVPEWVKLLGDKTIAMLLGVFAAIVVAATNMKGPEIEKAINSSLASAGIVLLITGAGGALGNVLTTAGVGNAITTLAETIRIHPILLAWLVAALLKVAQGSGTVAMITAISILAPAVPTLGINPLWIGLAGFSGSLMGAHVNDSGFWVTAKLAGLTTTGGLKTYTVMTALQSVISIILIFIASSILG